MTNLPNDTLTDTFGEEYEQWLDAVLADFYNTIDYELTLMDAYFRRKI